jgi:hypothetical protein
MLPLNDPLWKKLDDAHRDRDIPELLSGLTETWSDETAKSLFWDCLCRQETCYGATYAAIPHLLKIAEPEKNRHQRLEIALFTGFVALCVLDPRRGSNGEFEGDLLPGLPQTLDAWDRKLDCFRGLAANLDDPDISHYERTVLLPRFKKMLAIEPVHAGDLQKIESIRADFYSALPTIRSVCERTLLENLHDKDAVSYMLSGIAAADGLLNLARLLHYGSEGWFRCSRCEWRYQYILFGDRVAIYADENSSPILPRPDSGEGRALRDFKEHAPSRSDGFVAPARKAKVLTAVRRCCFPWRTVHEVPSQLCCCAIFLGPSFVANAARGDRSTPVELSFFRSRTGIQAGSPR